MCKPGFDKKGNIKLGGKMWTLSKLYGSQEWFIEKYGIYLKGTCGKYCKGCCNDCYVKRSYRYGSVILKHGTNTLALRNDIIGFFAILDGQLTRAKNKPEQVRYDQSGEIESRQEFSLLCDLAAAHNYSQFYLYTKAFDLVIPEILERYETGRLPENLTVLISIWHEYGIAEYESIKHIPNVKAFVYNDGFEYPFEFTTRCTAYNGRKLNHNITCDKCRKCFDRKDIHKIISCDSH